MQSLPEPPRLSGVVVHWRNEELLARLTAAWPRDPRFELVVVDNGSSGELSLGPARLVRPERNLGFGGGANAGVAEARGAIVLILNPDAIPEEGALDRLLEGFEAYPETAGLAPKLIGPGGESQAGWQLRHLPSPWQLLLQAFPFAGAAGTGTEPEAGAAVEQPAAAALAFRREALEGIGGFDDGFHPAWFEDVDLARRMKKQRLVLRYWPAAVFRHGLGSTVPRLGYGRFLWIYYRNLTRYLGKHHGPLWALAFRIALVPGMAVRLLLLPLWRPRRAATRAEAFRGLIGVLGGTITGWRGRTLTPLAPLSHLPDPLPGRGGNESPEGWGRPSPGEGVGGGGRGVGGEGPDGRGSS
jgi:N-acetylglucosaminyl-diphospho-decaprenol L-rhamnosyltransferase